MKNYLVIFSLLLSCTCFGQSFWIRHAVSLDPFSKPEFDVRIFNDSNAVDGSLKIYTDTKSIYVLDCTNIAKSLGLSCYSSNFEGISFVGNVENELIGSSSDSNGYFTKLSIKSNGNNEKITHVMEFSSGHNEIPEEWTISFFALQIR